MRNEPVLKVNSSAIDFPKKPTRIKTGNPASRARRERKSNKTACEMLNKFNDQKLDNESHSKQTSVDISKETNLKNNNTKAFAVTTVSGPYDDLPKTI